MIWYARQRKRKHYCRKASPTSSLKKAPHEAGLCCSAHQLNQFDDACALCSSNHVCTCWYQNAEFCGFKIQWFSFGKYT